MIHCARSSLWQGRTGRAIRLVLPSAQHLTEPRSAGRLPWVPKSISRRRRRRLFITHANPVHVRAAGYRATVQWQRERWAALPDVPYKGITFTMPDVLWPLFRDNPALARALPALAATLIQSKAGAQYGLQIGIMDILHTFNGKLEFNSYVHAMVTTGGLRKSPNTWVNSVYYNRDEMMRSWRKAVISLCRRRSKQTN